MKSGKLDAAMVDLASNKSEALKAVLNPKP
jgi:hypothetical protein